MTLWHFIPERFSELSTIALHIYFLYKTFYTKIGLKKQFLAGAIFVCVRMLYYMIGFGWRPFFSVIASIIYANFVFTGQFHAYLVWMIFSVTLDGIVDACIVFFYLLFPNTFVTQVRDLGETRIVIIIVAKAILFIVYYLCTKKIKKSNLITWQDCFSLLMVPVGCWVLLVIIFRYSAITIGKEIVILLAVGSFALLLIMASVIALYNRLILNVDELAQSKLQIETTKMTQEHINHINDMYSKLSTVRHDLRNHFIAIAGYLQYKEYGSLEQYIEGLTDCGVDVQEYTNHPVINVLISSKANMAQKSGIDFTANIEMPDNLPVSDVDVCILMSNILDNAFEANYNAIEPHFINIHTKVVDSYWGITCQNATQLQGGYRTTGSIKSTKDGKGIHGIGTKQIQRIAEKSGGFVIYRHENYKFTTLAMIKLSD